MNIFLDSADSIHPELLWLARVYKGGSMKGVVISRESLFNLYALHGVNQWE